MNKPWAVHVGAGSWQSSAIKRVADLGYQTLAVDGDPEATGFKLADSYIVADISSPADVAKAVRKYFDETYCKPTAVVCTACEAGMLAAANLREVYGLQGMQLALAKKLISKGEQRYAWRGLTSPQYVLMNRQTIKIASVLTELVSDNVIVKPVDSSGSRGITVARRDEINLEDLERALSYSRNGEIIVEEFVTGKEYTIESIRLDGISYPVLVTSKQKVAGTESTVANTLVSCKLNESQAHKFCSLVQQAHDALDYNNGVCHTEVIMDNEGTLWLVETAGRGAGFGVSESFIQYAAGYDYFEASLCFDLGLPVVEPPRYLQEQVSAVRFLETLPGIFAGIDNQSDVEVKTLMTPGTKMCAPKTDGDRVAYFYVKAKNNESVSAEINDKLDKIRINVA